MVKSNAVLREYESSRPVLSPTTVARYVRRSECSRFFELTASEAFAAAHREKHDYRDTFDRPGVVSGDGLAFESAVVSRLTSKAHTHVDFEQDYADEAKGEEHTWRDSIEKMVETLREYLAADSPAGPVVFTQPPLGPKVEQWQLRGRADAITVWRGDIYDIDTHIQQPEVQYQRPQSATNHLYFHIADAKTAVEEETYHQIQVATYTLLLRSILEAIPGVTAIGGPEKDTQDSHPQPDALTAHVKQNDTSLHVSPEAPLQQATYAVGGGVITRDTDLSLPPQPPIDDLAAVSCSEPAVMPGDVPYFSLPDREQDVRRLLSADGPLNRLWNSSPDSTKFSLTEKCKGCPHRSACFASATQDSDLAVLGLSPSEQLQLHDVGVKTVADLAGLAYPPDDPTPTDPPELTLKTGARDTYMSLVSTPSLGESLNEYIIRAQSHLGLVESTSFGATGGKFPIEIPGSRSSKLPEDAPPFDIDAMEDLGYPEGSLVRIYLTPHVDLRFDTLAMMSAVVTSTASNASSQTIAIRRESFPETETAATAAEQSVYTDFVDEVGTAVEAVLDGMAVTKAPLHFYTFTSTDADVIEETARQYRTVTAHTESFAELLESRAGIDEQMLSPVKPEIEQQQATGTPAASLLQYWTLTHPSEEALPGHAFTYTRVDGTEVNLRKAFRYGLFDYSPPYAKDGTAPQVSSQRYGDIDSDGRIPLWPTPTGRVPLDYLAATQNVLTEAYEDTVGTEYDAPPITSVVKYVDAGADNPTRITAEDVEAVAVRLTQALQHVERSIQYKTLTDGKHTYSLADLKGSLSHDTASPVDAALEYLQLEHESAWKDLREHLSRPIESRTRAGKTIPLVITEIEDTDDPSTVTVHGNLIHSLYFDNPDEVANSCRHTGETATSSGSWLVANPLDGQGKDVHTSPQMLMRGVPITVDEYNPDQGTVVFTANPSFLYKSETEFEYYHRDFTVDEAEATDGTTLFAPGEALALDPLRDDLTSQRIYDALSNADTTPVGYGDRFLQELFNTSNSTAVSIPETDLYSEVGVDTFATWTQTALPYTPNSAQQSFITRTAPQLVALQGPPGTGKTSGALAPGILARIFGAGIDGTDTTSIVVAESNKAINEVLADVADLYATYTQSPITTQFTLNSNVNSNPDDSSTPIRFNVDLVRLVTDPPATAHQHPSVHYVATDDEKTVSPTDLTYTDVTERIRNSSNGQQTLSRRHAHSTDTPDSTGNTSESTTRTLPATAHSSDARPHTVIFTTPSRLRTLINKIDTNISPAEWIESGGDFFDIVALDEASMSRLPSFLFSSAYAHNNSQILLSGDHRQMPPVQQHDWRDEHRHSITSQGAHLSLLDYIRVLRGDYDPHTAPFNADKLGDHLTDTDYEIPLIQLPTGYRSHETVTEFLRSHIYTHDNLTYQTTQTAKTPPPTPTTPGSRAALAPATPLTLIVHDDTTSHQANPTEAAICHTLATDRNQTESFGIVTPHNAQRGLLTTEITNADVDTVERYQGDERDIIAVSATAAAQTFLQQESDFILNPNRLTVAMSRMRHKLIIIASKNVFNLIPPDTNTYDNAHLWKSLLRERHATTKNNAIWSGSLNNFCAPATIQSNLTIPNTTVSIY
jgi:hypothetical protein